MVLIATAEHFKMFTKKHTEKNPCQREIHLRAEIQGPAEPELRPLKLKVTSQPFCLPTSDTRSQRKKKSRLAREEAALPFHQRTKRETSKEKKEKYQSSETPHLNSKASERKKKKRKRDVELYTVRTCPLFGKHEKTG